jgi:drug/metabolite transporter (DMT)-like permease
MSDSFCIIDGVIELLQLELIAHNLSQKVMVNQHNLSLNSAKDDSFSPAFLLLLLGIFISSFAAIFTRIIENELGPAATIFNRYYVATIVLFLWDGIRQAKIDNLSEQHQVINLKDWALFLLSSVLGTTNFFLWALSLTQTSVANSNLFHNLTPIFATLGGWLFFHQRFDYKFLLGLVLAIIGSASIAFSDSLETVNSLIGDSLALLSAVFYALNYLLREYLRSKFSATTILLWSGLFCGCVTFVLALITERQLFPTSWQTWLAVICLAVFCHVIAQGLLIHNLKQFSSGFISLLTLLEPLLTALIAWVIFAEKLTALDGVAFLLVLTGLYLAKLSKGSQKLAGEEEISAEVA